LVFWQLLFGQAAKVGDMARQPRKVIFVGSVHPETVFSDVILRSKATKNLMVKGVSRDSSLRSE
jgi:hypothetical protein